jgi:hypothetical protein
VCSDEREHPPGKPGAVVKCPSECRPTEEPLGASAVRSLARSGTGLLLVVLLASPTVARAQPLPETIQRLPPIEAGMDGAPRGLEGPTFRMAGDPPELRRPEDVLGPFAPGYVPLVEPADLADGPHLRPYKDTFFQKLSFTGTQIFKDGSEGLGLFEADVFAAFAVPAPTTKTPLLLIPSLETTFVDGPSALALPSQLYAAHFDFMWLPRVGERWRGMLMASPGWYSDFQGDATDSFRFVGQAVARYDWVLDRFQLVAGAAYINRINRRWLPVAGIIWKPTDEWSFDLVFPQGKIGRRIGWGAEHEHWLYLAGGFGGNNWRVERPGGTTDNLALMDWRLMLGWERKRDGGAGVNVEVGYVFSREAEFDSTDTTYDFGATLLLRGIVAF